MFPRNEGIADRIARTVAGSALLGLAAGLAMTSSRRLASVAALLGATLVATAATGSCQLYRPFGFRTARGDL
jgi:uncharacterized membrane protein